MTAFMERASAFVSPAGGYWAMINIPSWMFLASYEALREELLSQNAVSSLVHLGSRCIWPGFRFGCVCRSGGAPSWHGAGGVSPPIRGTRHVRSNAEIEALFLDPEFQRFVVGQSGFDKIPGRPIAYWVDRHLLDLYDGALIGDRFDIKAGVGTRNDDMFMRFHWEVNLRNIGRGRRWILTDKAGEFRKWYAGFIYVMDWENDGRRIKNYRNPDGSLKSRPQNIQYLFLEGITWGKVGAGATSFRWRPAGHGFNDAAPAIFGDGVFDLLAQLNTNVNKRLVEIKGSTVNVQTGMIAELPIIGTSQDESRRLRSLSMRAVEISKHDWDSEETSLDFSSPALMEIRDSERHWRSCAANCWRGRQESVSRLSEIEVEIEQLIRRRSRAPATLAEGESMGVVSLRANPEYRYGRRKVDDLGRLCCGIRSVT